MMMRQITLAALAALFVTTGAGIASAESNVGVGAPSPSTSAGMEADWSATRSIASMHPRASMKAYGSANHRRHITVTKHGY
jgi:hypothetical protein